MWERTFQNSDLSLDKYDNCLMTDTLKVLTKSSDPYGLKVNYSLTSGIIDSTEFIFSFPDSVENLALELFFDQALIVKAGNYDDLLFLRKPDEYKTDPKPKPVLIVKYLDPVEEIFLEPTWFDYFHITKRPKYILHNNSNYGLSTPTKDMFSCFFGKLMYLDSSNHWGFYPYGRMCGTFSCQRVLGSGQTEWIIEGFPIGDPRKLREGYYRYFVPFKDIAEIDKTVDTYFNVYYAK